MKFLFLNNLELSDVLSEIKNQNQNNEQEIQCHVGYSDELDTDVLEMKLGEAVTEVPISSLFNEIGKHQNVQIESYDVIEVGDFGEGFAFMLQ